MSGFTESALERKLAELNPSQQSIQTLSMWLVHHRKHHSIIVKIWYKEFIKAQDHRKLTFLYLANDVVQNSRKKSGDFLKSFAPILKKTLEYIARVPSEKTKSSVLRILRIWEDRSIYDQSLLKEYEKCYLKAWSDLHGFDVEEEVNTPKESDAKHEEKAGSGSASKKKSHHGGKRHSSRQKEGSKSSKRFRSKKEEIECALRKQSLEATNTIEEWEVDGVTQLEVKLSPSTNKEPPTEDEIISMIKELEKMPSTDAMTRGKIANLPPEVSDTAKVDEICIDSDITRSVKKKIESAYALLDEYNQKLDKELEDRKSASMKLQDFVHMQKDLLTQAEHRLEEHQNHIKILTQYQEELKGHVLSMPDLTKLPSVTDGLAPLPSAGDLFNL